MIFFYMSLWHTMMREEREESEGRASLETIGRRVDLELLLAVAGVAPICAAKSQACGLGGAILLASGCNFIRLPDHFWSRLSTAGCASKEKRSIFAGLPDRPKSQVYLFKILGCQPVFGPISCLGDKH